MEKWTMSGIERALKQKEVERAKAYLQRCSLKELAALQLACGSEMELLSFLAAVPDLLKCLPEQVAALKQLGCSDEELAQLLHAATALLSWPAEQLVALRGRGGALADLLAKAPSWGLPQLALLARLYGNAALHLVATVPELQGCSAEQLGGAGAAGERQRGASAAAGCSAAVAVLASRAAGSAGAAVQ